MKLFFTTCLLMVFNSFSQEVYSIKKESACPIYFDEGEALSLINVLQSIHFFRYYDRGIPQDIVDGLSAEERSVLRKRPLQPGTTPLIDEDPNSPNFGEYLIVTDPETGMQSYVYDAPDTLYTTFSDICEFRLTLLPHIRSEIPHVSAISLYKMFGDRKVEVLRLEGDNLLSMHGFEYFRKLNPDDLVNVAGDSYWKTLEDQHSSALLFYFPIPPSFFTLSGALINEDAPKLDIQTDLYFDMESKASIESLEQFIGKFDYHWEQPMEPLIDWDPDSPNYGENKIYVDPVTKEKSFVYAPPRIQIDWVSEVRSLYLLESYNDVNSDVDSRRLEAVYGVVNLDGEQQLVSVHYLNKNKNEGGVIWRDTFFQELSPLDIPAWRKELIDCLKEERK